MSKTPVLVVLGVLGAGLASIATNVATEALPVGVVPYRWVAWPMLVALAGVGIVVKLRETQPDELRADASPREVRDALISRVREYWVKSVLRESLYEVARIDLDMTVSANVRHPWGLTVAAPGMAPEALPPGTRMVEIVARFDGLLLAILGR